MPKPKWSANIEKNFMDAIDQLVGAGEEVTFASVAKEAGRARGLISKGHEKTSYPNVRERILELRQQRRIANPPARPRAVMPWRPEFDRVVAENKAMAAEIAALRSALAAEIVVAAGATDLRLKPQMVDMEQRVAARKARQAKEATFRSATPAA